MMQALCGDGLVEGSEACDDGNEAAGDGCDAACAVEAGFSCQGAPSVCAIVCGDGVKGGDEDCDDGNTTPGDGCAADCLTEPGYACSGEIGQLSACAAVCGDGLVVGSETCDDSNAKDGDGCSAACQFEASCGNKVLEPGESCDDGNTTSGDKCSGACQVEPGTVCGDAVDLNDAAKVTKMGNVTVYNGATTGSALVNFGDPSCDSMADPVKPNVPTVLHRYRIGNKPATLSAQTLNVGGSLTDTIVYSYLNCFDLGAELACNDDLSPGMIRYSLMKTGVLPAGTTVFIVVRGYYVANVGPYRLQITETTM